MDSLSHALLGGAIAQAALGRQLGNRAVCYGMGVALLPDIDVPLGELMGDAAALTFHRGITHSLLFATLLAPLLGWLAARLHRQAEVGWRVWGMVLWWVLLSHLALDAFTSYGIQLLLPFSDRSFALASISVIDPLYTLPLLLTVPILLWFGRQRPARQWLAVAGIGLSSLYLGVTLVNQSQVQQVFQEALKARGERATRIFVKPTFFNNLLWRGIAEVDEGYLVGFHSLLDDGPPREFVRFDRNAHYLEPYRNAPVIRDLLKVSHGYYQVVERDGELFFHDLRYGQAFEWLRDDRPHVFTYRIMASADGKVDIETLSLRVNNDRDRETGKALIRRIMGEREPQKSAATKTKPVSAAQAVAEGKRQDLSAAHSAKRAGVTGIDVSHFQGSISWKTVAEQSVDFVFIKATQGAHTVDNQFRHNWEQASANGILRGVYHYLDPSIDAVAQAEHFIDITRKNFGDFPPVIDIEAFENRDAGIVTKVLDNFIAFLANHTDCRPIIYTSRGFWDALDDHQYGSYPLWLADYADTPTLPSGWQSWLFWQYTQQGRVKGITGRVDKSHFDGSVEQLTTLSCSQYSNFQNH